MAVLPDKTALFRPRNETYRSGRAYASADTTAAGRGLSALGSGLSNLGADLQAQAEQARKEGIVADVPPVDSKARASFFEYRASLDQDTDYDTQYKRTQDWFAKTADEYAAGIKDPQAREQWKNDFKSWGVGQSASILDSSKAKAKSAQVTRLAESLDTYGNIFVDPTKPEADRLSARDHIAATIDSAEKTGLITPETAYVWRQKNLEDRELTFAKLWREKNPAPEDPVSGTADAGSLVSRVIQAESSGRPDAESPKGALGLMQVMPATAPEIARELGDQNFPFNDPQEIRTYLQDPEISKRYGTHYLQKQLDRYGGDQKAALIAYNAGPRRADAWMKAGKDDSVLPAETRDYVKKILGGGAGAVGKPAVDLGPDNQMNAGSFRSKHYTWSDLRNDRWADSTISTRAVGGLDWVTDQFGQKLKITSGYRSPNHATERVKQHPGQHTHGQAIDIDVSGMSDEQRSRLVSLFVQAGARGIGHYPPTSSGHGTIHVDFRSNRGKEADGLALWYGKQGYTSGDAWFKTGIEQGRAARGSAPRVEQAPPNYDSLTPEQRSAYDNFSEARTKEEKAERKRLQVEAKAAIETAMANAPVAIQNFGTYSGSLPTAEDFTRAYGEDGLTKYQEMQQAIDVSKQVYDFQTMPRGEIEAAVEAAKPTSDGTDAALQQDRYELIAKAAKSTLDARDKDPVGYAMQAFPAVSKAWEGVDASADGYQGAVAATVAAQQALGIPADKVQPLPRMMADKVANTYLNAELPQDERVNALAAAVLSTRDPQQQAAIFKQLVAAGVPDYVEGALDAVERGDAGAARRLMMAAMVDPDKLPGKAPVKPGEVDEAIQATLFAQGEIADVYYGLSGGSVENYDKARRDKSLLERAVNMRLRSGEAIDTAVQGAAKDLFGDVVVMPETDQVRARILIGREQDPEPVQNLLRSYRANVYQSLRDSVQAEIDRADPKTGARAVIEAAVQNRIEDIMDTGYFVERNGGYAYIDPYTGLPVAGSDGRPLVLDKTGYAAQSGMRIPQRSTYTVGEVSLADQIRRDAEAPAEPQIEPPTITVRPRRRRPEMSGRAMGVLVERSVPVEGQ